MNFSAGPLPAQQPDLQAVDQYGNPLPAAPPQGVPAAQLPPGSGIDGPPLTPQQVKYIQRLAALWGFAGQEEGMERERSAIDQLQQNLTPHGRMVGDVYVRQGPAATLLGGALQAGLVGPRVAALRRQGEDLRRAQGRAGRAAYQLQGLVPGDEEE